ncbi:expressed protein [Echinococcus multilocularis]|uniref:Expressed protein n=1 Tax=Echinococcus multilocularis TaxID=6211 RepID=A0A087VWY1_ECHMU|nr:expressed protein [Echinococcus multilocularis]
MRTTLLLLATLTIIHLLPTALSLKCVVCNSFKDGEACANWDTLSYIEECLPGNKTLCAKIEQYTEGKKRVVRKCSDANTELGCIRRICSDNRQVRHCHCREPLCNPATRGQVTLGPLAFLTVFLLAQF